MGALILSCPKTLDSEDYLWESGGKLSLRPLDKSVVRFIRDRSVTPHGLGGWDAVSEAYCIPGSFYDGIMFWLKPEKDLFLYGRSEHSNSPSSWVLQTNMLQFGEKYWLGKAFEKYLCAELGIPKSYVVSSDYEIVDLNDRSSGLKRLSDGAVLPFSLFGIGFDNQFELGYFSYFAEMPIDSFIKMLSHALQRTH